MQYLKKSFNKLKKDEQMKVTNDLIEYLEKIKDNLNKNLNGEKFISYIGFDNEEKLIIKELKYECKLKDQYTKKQIIEMENEIKENENKLKIYNEIINISVFKEEYYDHNEGWKTTNKKIIIVIELKNNIKLEFDHRHQYNAYDGSKDYYKNLYINKNNINMKLNEDFYKENGKYYNGKKINKKEINSMTNFQKKLKEHCKKNKIQFDELSENEVLSLLNDIKKDTNKLKEEIHENEKNKNTPWTFLVNITLDKLEDKDGFDDLFDVLD